MFWTVLSVLMCLSVIRTQVIPGKARANDGDFNTVNTDGSFDFGYVNKDVGASYHLSHGNANKVVGGRFGARDPATSNIKETVYTAGPRGFRAKGPNIHRRMDLDQRPRGPIGNKDDPYFDPNEDPSYSFKQDTRTYSKEESADARGDVKGHYSYVDDIGERHDVTYIAGRDTGFHVSSAQPDSPNVIGAPFHRAPLVRGEAKSRGRTAVQRGLDGSYRFISAGPDQRRTESSDSLGNVRGSYTFLDDKGVQRTVHYIAGPGIGYRIVKNGQDPYIPAYFPTIPSVYDPDFASVGPTVFSPEDTGSDDVFKNPDGTAASGHVKPSPFPTDKDRPSKRPIVSTNPTSSTSGQSNEIGDKNFNKVPNYNGDSFSNSDSNIDSYVDEDVSGFIAAKPTTTGTGKPSRRPVRPYRPGKKPYVPLKPFQTQDNNDDNENYGTNFDYNKNSNTRPGSSVGIPAKKPFAPFKPDKTQNNNNDNEGYGTDFDSNKNSNRPGSGVGIPGKKPYAPFNPVQNQNNNNDNEGYGTGFDSNKNSNNRPGSGVGLHIDNSRPGITIIRNIGEDFFSVPPGVSVRAHVQSIDLYPYDSKRISPSEAIEKDKT